MSELNDQAYDTICRLCEQGDTLAEDGQYAEALDLYWQAWDLLPEPKTDWEAATWILAAIGDADFFVWRFCRRARAFKPLHVLPGRNRQPVFAFAFRTGAV